MKASQSASDKIMDRDALHRQALRWRFFGKRVVFTNGCFDILHAGHLDLLAKAAAMGDVLVVGLNADASVRRLKGAERPVNDEGFRARMLASLSMVDAVCIFPEDTPLELLEALLPDVLVKGGDYVASQVVGADLVTRLGGQVEIVPLVEGHSTSGIIARIRAL